MSRARRSNRCWHRAPERKEFARLLERRLHYLHDTVAESPDYRVLAGVEELLPHLLEEGYLLGLVTGNLEAAAHIKLHRARLNRFFSFGGYGSDSTDRGELTRVALRRASLVYGEEIAPAAAIAVGDTPHDVTGAHAAGIQCVGGRQPQIERRRTRSGRRRLHDRLTRGRAAAVGVPARTQRTSYDAVIVGGGHNGLVAAAYLARAGRSCWCSSAVRSSAARPSPSAPFAGRRREPVALLLPRQPAARADRRGAAAAAGLRRRQVSSYTPTRAATAPRPARRRLRRGGDARVVPAR